MSTFWDVTHVSFFLKKIENECNNLIGAPIGPTLPLSTIAFLNQQFLVQVCVLPTFLQFYSDLFALSVLKRENY